MPDDPLKRWLRWADEAAGAPTTTADDLAARVRHLAVRRRRSRISVGAAALLAAGLAGTLIWTGVTDTGPEGSWPPGARRDALSMAECLLTNGADVRAANRAAVTPLWEARYGIYP